MRKFKNFGVELVGYEHGYCNDVLIRDSFAFLSASWDGLRIVDVTNRSKPSATGGINLGNSANHIALLGDIAYIAESTDDFNPKPVGVHIIDTTDKANPIAIQQVVLDYLVDNVVVKDNRLFAIATYGAEPFQSTIHVMDCAAPAQPVPIGVYKMAKRAHALAFFERYALIANGYGGLQMVDALVPSDLKPISSYTAAEVADVAISNGFIFIAANSAPAILSGLRILQFRPNTGISEVGRFAIPAPIQRVAIDSDRAYVTDAWHGIWVIDITNKANPTQPGFYGIEYAKGVAVCDGFIYVAGHIMGYLSCNPLRDNNCQAKGCPTMACTGLASPRSARLASR